MDAAIPILLSLADMDRFMISYVNKKDILSKKPINSSVRIQRSYGHTIVIWDPFMQSLYTKSELKRLHRSFGHTHTNKLINLLKRADQHQVDARTHAILDNIATCYKLCQFHSQKPRLFKFSRKSEKILNQLMYVYIISIDENTLLHVMDEVARYQAT